MRKYERTVYYNKDGQRHRDNDLPAVEFTNGTKYWFQNGQIHRVNVLPAIEFSDGSKHWYQNGVLYRVKGPVVERANGRKEWFWKGKYCGTGDTPPEKFLRLKAKAEDNVQD